MLLVVNEELVVTVLGGHLLEERVEGGLRGERGELGEAMLE